MMGPYQRRILDRSGRTARMSDLMREDAAIQANAEMQAGQASAQMAQGIGNAVSGVADAFAQSERERPQREFREAQAAEIKQGLDTKRQITEVLKLTRNPETGELDLRQAAKEISALDPMRAQEFFQAASEQDKSTLLANKQRLEQLGQLAGSTLLNLERLPPPQRAAAIQNVAQEAVSRGLVQPEDIPEQPTESWLRQAFTSVLSTADLAEQLAAQQKPEGPLRVNPGETLVDPTTMQPVYSAPAKPEKPPGAGTLDGFLAMLAQEKGSALTSAEALQARRQFEAAGRAPQQPAADNEPLVAVMGDDGRPVMLRRSQAEGRSPASSREQGRPVTSGDAGRMAELDTSLDDVWVLRQAVTGNEATGTGAYLGTKVPNLVTEITGWGSDAKSKNAVIARVKQVIGKALEGGVLRKEDEEKYKDILPTISDPPAVVTIKIDGLEKAIALRKERELDAREDAGYDVSKFRQRLAAPPMRQSDTGQVILTLPNGMEAEFPDRATALKAWKRLGAQ